LAILIKGTRKVADFIDALDPKNPLRKKIDDVKKSSKKTPKQETESGRARQDSKGLS
jgi:hypothetical protein